MLGRATQNYESSTAKNDLAKQLFPSSSPVQDGNIQEQFKKARQSSQSIGGFTGYTNPCRTSTALRPRSPNIKTSLKRRSDTVSAVTSTCGLSSVLSKRNSFQDTPDTVDYTQTTSKVPTHSQFGVLFDENDFEDDADIDLDQDFDIPPATSNKVPRKVSSHNIGLEQSSAVPTTVSMAAPLKPASQKYPNTSQSPYALPQSQRTLSRPQESYQPSSSAMTWSSSPLSHKEPPLASVARQQQQKLVKLESVASQDIEQNPRAGKRRTLPWAEKRAEEEEAASRNEDMAELLASQATTRSSQPPRCFRCRQEGHYVQDCPNRGKGIGMVHDYTPLAKDKNMPWNKTGSAIKEQRNAFKEKKAAAKKTTDGTPEVIEHPHRRKKAGFSPISLSEEQRRVQELVCSQKKSVFFTGSAGTGKSVLMRSIIAELRKQYVRDPDRVAVTASTGLAACNIGGVTLHSFGGIGLGKEDVPTLVKKIKRNAKAKNRWIKTKVLIIDEISMVDGDLFDKLEGIARAMRNNGRPFGGIQLVVTGDFFQLPPVPDYENKARGVKFAFDAGTWSTAIHHTIGLTEVFRQKDPGNLHRFSHRNKANTQ